MEISDFLFFQQAGGVWKEKKKRFKTLFSVCLFPLYMKDLAVVFTDQQFWIGKETLEDCSSPPVCY